MSRFLSLSILAACLFGAVHGRAAELASVDYFLPVTYDMVVTRSVPATASGDKTELKYEIVDTTDLLRSILRSNNITSLTNWTLVARGNAAVAAEGSDNSQVTDTLSSLKIVARNTVTGDFEEPASEIALSLAPTSDFVATSGTRRQTVPAEGSAAAVVSHTTVVRRLAQLTQGLAARGTRPAGTLEATGLFTYTNRYNEVAVGKDRTSGPVVRPVGGTFRASGPYGSDRMVELRIILGEPSYRKPAPAVPPAD
jgi:hypothetical protein